MRKLHRLDPDALRRIAVMYGKDIAEFGAVEAGYRNTSHSFITSQGERLNFILYKREPGSVRLIKRTNALGLHVAKSGLPVRKPIDDRIVQAGQRYGSLYDYMPGETIAWEMYAMKHIKLLGFGLARFHAAAKDFDEDLLDVEIVYEEIWQRVMAYFADKSVIQAMREKLGFHVRLPDVAPLLANVREMPNRQPLHMDFVRSNLLFRAAEAGDELVVDGVALSGILDLEKAARGHVVFDLARTLAFLMVDCPKPVEKIFKYFLYSGYVKRGEQISFVFSGEECYEPRSGAFDSSCQLVSSNSAGKAEPSLVSSRPSLALCQLITMFLTYDLYKFLRQNPYESLANNHHFNRTVDILRDRKVIK